MDGNVRDFFRGTGGSGSLAVWAGVFVTFLLALVAVFQDRLRRLVWSPDLQLDAEVRRPECHKTTWRYRSKRLSVLSGWPPGTSPIVEEVEVGVPCYFFRVSVLNKGRAEAREVELFAKALRRRKDDGTFEVEKRFFPMNLLWTNFEQPFLEVLSPHVPKMCDVAYVLDPKHKHELGHILEGLPTETPLLAFRLQVIPNMKGHLVGPGLYHLDLVLGASNCKPKEYTLEIDYRGNWIEDEDEMLRNGLRMRLL